MFVHCVLCMECSKWEYVFRRMSKLICLLKLAFFSENSGYSIEFSGNNEILWNPSIRPDLMLLWLIEVWAIDLSSIFCIW